MVFLLLAVIASYWNQKPKNGRGQIDNYTKQIRTAFTIAVVMLTLVGLETHYWDNIWQVFGFCIGIRASLKAHRAPQRTSRAIQPLTVPNQRRLTTSQGVHA